MDAHRIIEIADELSQMSDDEREILERLSGTKLPNTEPVNEMMIHPPSDVTPSIYPLAVRRLTGGSYTITVWTSDAQYTFQTSEFQIQKKSNWR